MNKLFLAFILTICTLKLSAQETGEDKLGSWHMYFGTNRISDRLSIHSEVQLRYFEQAKNFNQLLLRTGLNYHINPNATATVGYGYIDTDPTFVESPRESNLGEHRIFEQFIIKNKVSEFLFEHRYRLEQRFISQTNIRSDPEEDLSRTEHRARYRLQVTLPLTNIFFLNFYDEVFLNLQGNAFGQNRLYAALGIKVTENLSVQMGYLKNHFTSTDYDRLQVGVFYNPDLRTLFKRKEKNRN
ncbi:DUF2490 domain-containing protein [Maribacter sp. CXY002]|uniref:DUF2490 domain-containing protein n=1 Tax=Maribacter luteocoastalis TaxID=3407671 RepID=UPI003B67C5B1